MQELTNALTLAKERPGPIVFLTGAGISAESNIPTFRGEEGYWRTGSKHYHPQELATRRAFSLMPEVVWSWYLWRLTVCNGAEPNVAHHALARAGESLGERLLVVTQNVDGLHRRAGTPPNRLYEIHGNIASMRCARCPGVFPIPPLAPHAQGAGELTDEERAALVCSQCGERTRPHVLWFDEVYDEPLFRYESSLRAATDAALLVVVGTTGATNLPLQMGRCALERRVPMVVINPEPNPFSEMAERTPHGVFLQGTAGHWVPRVVECLTEGLDLAGPATSSGAASRAAPRSLMKVKGEGTSIALEGKQDPNGAWRYRVTTDSGMLAELEPLNRAVALERGIMEDGPMPGLSPDELYSESPWLDTWEAAMRALDERCWLHLWPEHLDREFAPRVLQEVRARWPAEEHPLDALRWQGWCQAAEPE